MNKYINPSLDVKNETYVSNDYLIDCSMGSNPFGSPARSQAWIKNYNGEGLAEYYDYSTIVDLTMLIASYVNFRAENVFIGNGSANCLSIIFYKFLNVRNSKMLGVGPQFITAISEWKMAGGEYHSIPLNLDSKPILPVAELCEELKRNDYAVLYIDNPNNPLGYVFSIEDIERLARTCQQTDTFLVVDEAYADYVSIEASAIQLIDQYSNVIVTRSFSKGLGLASIRTGYLVVSDEYIDCFRKIIMPFTPSMLSAKLAIEALQDDLFLQQTIEKTRHFKAELIQVFESNNIKTLATHEDTPIFTVYDKDVDLFALLSSVNIITESGVHFVATNPIFNNSYCRVRIPGNQVDIHHINYRLNHLNEG